MSQGSTVSSMTDYMLNGQTSCQGQRFFSLPPTS